MFLFQPPWFMRRNLLPRGLFFSYRQTISFLWLPRFSGCDVSSCGFFWAHLVQCIESSGLYLSLNWGHFQPEFLLILCKAPHFLPVCRTQMMPILKLLSQPHLFLMLFLFSILPGESESEYLVFRVFIYKIRTILSFHND